MEKYILASLVATAGMATAFQAILNTSLGKIAGTLEGAFISFGVGTVVAAGLLAVGTGRGQLTAATHAPWYLFIGGALGLFYVFSIIRATPQIGVVAAMSAGIAGQLLAGVIFDHLGILGTARIPFDIWRGLGVVLLIVALRLILR